MKIRRIKLKAVRGEKVVELYAEKKRKDGSTFTSAWLGTVDIADWIDFIDFHYEALTIHGVRPGTQPATLVDLIQWEEKHGLAKPTASIFTSEP